ncbi:type IV secretory system conjugative DNA transfer family protein [Crocosphaera sp. Alani8]|uniref:type IV secretory system conjugative DNA transfer family protein n=1 Tax=Crocosphaera sp. Alani8 TaxID=3038952 RepID=UPI00313DC02A
MPKTIIEVPSNFAFTNNNQNNQLVNALSNPMALTLIAIFGLYGVLSLVGDGSKKGKLSTAYWGGTNEKNKAAKKALSQINSPTRNSASLYIGTPDPVLLKLEEQWLSSGLNFNHQRKAASAPIYIPDIQRGVFVSGAAGTGKTFSVADPCIRSALDQGFPTLLYDFKFPTQSSRVIAYALKRGYKVRFFTPNFPFSDVCNLLDFLENEEDAVAAGQLAEVIAKNIDLNANASSDKFFEDAGATLVQGIFLLAKAVAAKCGKQYADLMTCAAILSLPQLGLRLGYSREQQQFPVWTMRPLAQLISVASAPETESSIIGTAQRTFEKFLKKDFIGAFSDDSTIPLDLDGKTLLVCGLDRNNRDIVGPLMAAVIHMIVSRNVSRSQPRKDPLCVFLDELPTLYLPMLYEWLTQNREDGFCGIVGFQNLAQLEKVYGKEVAKIIIGNCATKFIFNPQEVESAEYFSKALGEFDILYSTKSRSRNSGKSSGGSRSRSENRQKRNLFEISQFMKLGKGQAIIINPNYQRGDEEYIPIKQKIKVPQDDLNEMMWSQEQWPKLWDYFSQQNHQSIDDEKRRKQFEERYELVNSLFPLPPSDDQNNSQSSSNSNPPSPNDSPQDFSIHNLDC